MANNICEHIKNIADFFFIMNMMCSFYMFLHYIIIFLYSRQKKRHD